MRQNGITFKDTLDSMTTPNCNYYARLTNTYYHYARISATYIVTWGSHAEDHKGRARMAPLHSSDL